MRKLILLALVILCGCSFVPFEKTEYAMITETTPEDILRKYREVSPTSFKIINTVVFQFRTRKFLSLGYLSVDVDKQSFELAGMNSVGIKLVEIVAKNREITVNNVIEDIAKRGNVAEALSEDIYRIYLDQMSLADAQVVTKEKEIVFIQNDASGKTEYTFAGRDNYLVKKTYYEGKKKTWSVNYYEYIKKNNKVYPKGIIYKNYLYKYKLTINAKEII